MAKRPRTSKLTYGYKRAEVVGGLVNGVFLLAVRSHVKTSKCVAILTAQHSFASLLPSTPSSDSLSPSVRSCFISELL
jgi:Co/Zn/Cd efflux system component